MSLSSPVVHDVDSWDRAVSRFADLQKRRAALEAEELRLLADAVDMIRDAEAAYRGRAHGDRSIPLRSLVADLAVATGLSEWTVKRALGDAADLCDRFAAGVTALEQGRLTRRHLAVIHEAGAAIDDAELRDRYLQLALERAAETTAGRLGPIVETIAARVNPVSIDERHESAAERRGVWVREKGDAMGELVLAAPIVLVRAGYDRLTRFADEIVGTRDADAEAAAADDTEPDTRTMDQLRADALTDLLLTGTPAQCIGGDGVDEIRGVVQVTVPVLTAAGVGSEPSLLAGSGPIDAQTARRLLGTAAGWERVMTSPVTGAVLCVDRYRPSAGLDRFLRARDERCRFPGCRRSVWRCDADHTVPYSERAPTCVCNLAHLCKSHHALKHHGEWTVRQLGGGVLEWTSPTGRRSTDRPEPVVRFLPDAEPVIEPPSSRRGWACVRYHPHVDGPTPF